MTGTICCLLLLLPAVRILIGRRQDGKRWSRWDWLAVLMFAVGAIIWTQI